jgi:FkbM family methyltransferase
VASIRGALLSAVATRAVLRHTTPSATGDRVGDDSDEERESRLFKMLRRALSGATGMRSKHGAGLALDILAANGITEIAVPRPDGRLVHLSTRDKVIASSVLRTGSFGRANMAAFVAALGAHGHAPADLVFVNIGANIGTTCLNAFDAGFRRFVAVEPEPTNHALLTRNLTGLTGAQVRLLASAAGDVEGTATLHLHPTNLGRHSLVGPKSKADGAHAVDVPVKRLDDIVAPGTPFALFVDVEGFEPQVLRGGARALRDDCVAIALEVTPSRYQPADSADLAARLAAFAPEFTLLPEAIRHPVADLPGLIESRPSGHFDVILVRPGA